VLILPAKVEGKVRWVGCSRCRGLHEQQHDARSLLPGAPPIRAPHCPSDGDLARRLGARVVVLEDELTDDELIELADRLALAHAGWSCDSDGRWTHAEFGGDLDHDGAIAALLGLDALRCLQLAHLGARC
jgi:hypothetical protein